MSSTPTTQSPDEELQLTPLELQPTSTSANEDQTKEIAPFLRSLRRMLDRESDAILCWTADGKAFEIHDMDVMTNYILPKYFKHSKYTSFQRQLNYFNFRKWTKSRAVVCTFSNAFFVRDQPDLTWRITRKRGLSDAKSPGGGVDGGAASDGGDTSPRTPKPSPKASPKSRASTTAAYTSTAATKPATLKREQSASSSSSNKRKASSSTSSQTKKAKLSAASVVEIEAAVISAAVSPTDPVESLEWVDTLYPSLEALEAECSVSSNSSMQFSGYVTQSDPQVAFAWPQYFPASIATSSAGPLAAEPVDRFRAQPSSYEAYFVPTVVQTRCVAL